METFLPGGEIGIASGSASEVQPRVLLAEFGDGYTQRAGDGLNTMGKTYELSLRHLTQPEYAYVIAFFERTGGYRAFLWTEPGATVARKWIVQRWRTTDIAPGIFDISASFMQVFDN